LAEGPPVLALAPLFHITGLVCHVLTAFVMAAPLVISYRFEPGVMLDSIEEHQPEFMVGAITAFIAMMTLPSVRKEQFRSLRRVCSGGAPVPPSVAAQFRAKLGQYVLNGYGLTETNAPVIFAPTERESRVDARSGTLSIGLPLPMIDVWICDDNGSPAPWGESGEIVIAGRSVARGYWNKPEETAAAMRQDGFRTGDIGFMDADGWVYVIDCKKDMINAGGYKVWPREVEDVLYAHPAIREAAVVGVADPYRGETVKAVVSRATRPRPTRSSVTARSGWPPTNTRASSKSSTICRRRRAAKFCGGRCARRCEQSHSRSPDDDHGHWRRATRAPSRRRHGPRRRLVSSCWSSFLESLPIIVFGN
jgi:long-chain acyl-CoA synthetase